MECRQPVASCSYGAGNRMRARAAGALPGGCGSRHRGGARSCPRAGGQVAPCCAASHSPAPVRLGRRAMRCQALFGDGAGTRKQQNGGGSGKGGTQPILAHERERSALVNEELLYFIFQLDLDTQLQRALNYEAYEAAQEVRARRQKVDEALHEMQQRKAGNVGSEASSVAATSVDLAAEGLRLRAAMARAVEQENYKEAAALRDQLAALEVASKRAESLASELRGVAPAFRLGQRVLHRSLGYRGVVVGWDAQCCEEAGWLAAAGCEDSAAAGRPFYHLLVHQPDWEYDAYQAPVAYVPEDLLWAPAQGGPLPESSPSPLATPEASTWVQAFGPEPLQHPYSYILFLGQDGAGDYIPCRQLRDKYSVPRQDVYSPGDVEGGP